MVPHHIAARAQAVVRLITQGQPAAHQVQIINRLHAVAAENQQVLRLHTTDRVLQIREVTETIHRAILTEARAVARQAVAVTQVIRLVLVVIRAAVHQAVVVTVIPETVHQVAVTVVQEAILQVAVVIRAAVHLAITAR